MRLTLASSLLVLSSINCFAQTTPAGHITGMVINQEGQPIEQASVCVTVFTVGSANSRCHWMTDEQGHFDIRDAPFGTCYVTANKEEAGYSAVNQGRGQEVNLTASNASADVTVKLAPKAGMLTGSVKDSLTGKPVDKIQLSYISIDGQGNGVASGSNNGAFRFSIPTEHDYIILISAPGYKTWFYGDADGDASLRLASGEQKDLNLYLVPQKEERK